MYKMFDWEEPRDPEERQVEEVGEDPGERQVEEVVDDPASLTVYWSTISSLVDLFYIGYSFKSANLWVLTYFEFDFP